MKTHEEITAQIEAWQTTVNDFRINRDALKWYQFREYSRLNKLILEYEDKIDIASDELIDAPGFTGPLVDLFESELTEEEWHALQVVHLMRLRLEVGIRFDWSRSIDVRGRGTSQIIDEEVIYRNCPRDEEEQ